MHAVSSSIRSAVLGASGVVGQRFCELLSGHPFFSPPDLYSSEKSGGRKLRDVLTIPEPRISDELLECRIETIDLPSIKREKYDIIFSALPTKVAGDLELELAGAGGRVFTNASPNRMRSDVPLVVPEVNHEHLSMVIGGGGFIVANGNCSAIGLAMGLKPLQPFGIRSVEVTTLQALSGAGYPGVPSLDALSNVIPYIDAEEEKLTEEIPKMFGSIDGRTIRNASMDVNATCTRVPVRDGHTESVTVILESSVDEDAVAAAFTNFRSLPQEFSLPTAPEVPVILRRENNRPQPLLDVNAGEPSRARGMAATVGRLRVKGNAVRFVILTHNTIRGAAGGSVLNAEIVHKLGGV
ncbi:MAG: aspartate-semialdehyde dehydrogenase [Thermoplasmata archaeon]|nr:aspartate-semialdehyde dehydrogenase [Candidatus Sysuiplasma acidicola]